MTEMCLTTEKAIPHDYEKRNESIYSKELINYFSFLFRQPSEEVRKWYSVLSSEQRAGLHEALKYTVGSCALCHNPAGGKPLRLRCLAILAGAICPNPLVWLPTVDWSLGQMDILSVSSDHAQQTELLSKLIGDDGLFAQLFVHKTSGDRTINNVLISANEIVFSLDIDLFSFEHIPADIVTGKAKGCEARKAFLHVCEFLKTNNSPCCLIVNSTQNKIIFKHE